MSRGQSNMYFPCGGPGTESPHMQRGPCYPLSDVKMAGVPPGGNLKNIIIPENFIYVFYIIYQNLLKINCW